MRLIQIQDVKPKTWIFFNGKLLYLKEKNQWAAALCYHRKQVLLLQAWDYVTLSDVSGNVTTEGWV